MPLHPEILEGNWECAHPDPGPGVLRTRQRGCLARSASRPQCGPRAYSEPMMACFLSSNSLVSCPGVKHSCEMLRPELRGPLTQITSKKPQFPKVPTGGSNSNGPSTQSPMHHQASLWVDMPTHASAITATWPRGRHRTVGGAGGTPCPGKGCQPVRFTPARLSTASSPVGGD